MPTNTARSWPRKDDLLDCPLEADAIMNYEASKYKEVKTINDQHKKVLWFYKEFSSEDHSVLKIYLFFYIMYFLGLRFGYHGNTGISSLRKENIKITDDGFLVVKYFTLTKNLTDSCLYKVKVLPNIAKCFKKLDELTKNEHLLFDLNLPDQLV